MTPTREVYWNISHIWIMYALLVPTMLVFAYGIYRRVRLWQRGRPDAGRTENRRKRLAAVVVYVLGHKRMIQEKYSGLFHFFLFSGFIILVDILVNSAAVISSHFVEQMPIEEWDRIIAVDLRGAFLCTKFALPDMIRQRDRRIICIAGELAHTGGEGYAHLSAAKAGLIAFCKSLAREVGSHNVNVNVVSPGATQTSLLNTVPKDFLEKRFSQIPLGRFAASEEIAAAVVFFASDESRYITGQTLSVNGGTYML